MRRDNPSYDKEAQHSIVTPSYHNETRKDAVCVQARSAVKQVRR